MFSVLIASENKVKTSSIWTDSGEDLYSSNLFFTPESFIKFSSILFNSACRALPRFTAASGFLFTVLNIIACKASCEGSDILPKSLFTIISCSPVFWSWTMNAPSPDFTIACSLSFTRFLDCKYSCTSSVDIALIPTLSNWLTTFSTFLVSWALAFLPISFNELSISLILSLWASVSDGSLTLFISCCKVFFSVIKSTALAWSWSFSFKGFILFTAPWVSKKVLLVSSACFCVISPFNTDFFKLLSSIVSAFLFWEILTWASVILALGLKACSMLLKLVFFSSLFIL